MPLDEVFGHARPGKADEPDCPYDPVPCAEAVGLYAPAAVINEQRADAYRADHLHDADKAVELHEAGVVAGAVQHQLYRAVKQQEVPCGVPVAAAALHRTPAAAIEELKQDCRRDEHKQKLHKEGREAVFNGACGIRDAGSDGQVLERGRRYGDLAAAGAVEERAQADECDRESRPRGESVQQTGNAALKAKLLHNKRGKPHAEQRAGQAVAAGGIIGDGADKARVLLKVAIPMYRAAERHGEQQRQRQQQPHRGGAAAVRYVQRIAERKACGDTQGDDYRTPIYDRASGADFIVALGGGSSIDTAKGIGIVVNNPDFADVKSLEGVADTKHKAVPTFALPTTAGTAAEVTINYVIIDEDARKKMVCVDPNDIPAVAIVDPELMYSMPKGLTAATGMDALTHAIESYITPGAWAMSDMFELKAIEMIAQNLKAAVDNGKDVVAREAMSQAQYIAGMGFSNVGLGIVHSMAHPLGAFYDTPHGVANALLLPYVMEYNAESPAAPKYINIAKAMGVETAGMSEAEGVKAAIEAVKSLSLSIGIPQKLHEINVKEEDIPALAVAAFNDVCTGGNPRPTSVEDIEVLYRKAF